VSADETVTAAAEPIEATVVETSSEPEIVTPDVVETSTAVEPARDAAAEGHAALAAAEEAVLAMPGVPGRDEFLALALQARMLSMSGAAPKAVRSNPYVALHVAMVGRDLGISPSAALNLIDVIGDGDKTQLSLSPQLLNGQVRRLGLGRIARRHLSDSTCIAVALSPGGSIDPRCMNRETHFGSLPEEIDAGPCRCVGILGETDYSWSDAIDAGLVQPGCSPGAHTAACLNYRTGYRDRCREGWRSYPRRMLWWRASGYATDDFFPEAGLGLYSPEELGAVVDDEGRPIDPSTVELPPGFDDPNAPTPPEELAPIDERRSAFDALMALPEDARGRVNERGNERNLPHPRECSARQLTLLLAIVRGEADAARRNGYDYDRVYEARLASRGASTAVSADETAPTPDPAPKAPAAPEKAPGPVSESPGDILAAEGTDATIARSTEIPADVCTTCGDPIADHPFTHDPTTEPVASPETALDGPESASTVDPPSPPPETSSGATIAAEVAETISSIPQDVIDSTMATVQAMTVRQVDAQLRERSIEVKGNAAAKRMRLFQVVAAERAAGDPAAAELF